jgi:HEAT repeat protein
VRASAAEALGGDSGALGALLAALDDASIPVVRAALLALARTPGDGVAAPLVAVVDDGRRNPSLRRDAAEVLGQRCERAALDGLEESVLGLSDPALPPHEQDVGQAALAALARIDLPRARALLARMQGDEAAAAAVERAARGGRGTAAP